MIRADAGMPISGFTRLLGIPRRPYTRWRVGGRPGQGVADQVQHTGLHQRLGLSRVWLTLGVGGFQAAFAVV